MKDYKDIIENPLDDEGYPAEEYLELIKNWKPSTCRFDDLFNSFLHAWNHGIDGWTVHHDKKKLGVIPVEFHTLGWSGNESIINAILDNIYITHLPMKLNAIEEGGHYYFALVDDDHDIYTALNTWTVILKDNNC